MSLTIINNNNYFQLLLFEFFITNISYYVYKKIEIYKYLIYNNYNY